MTFYGFTMPRPFSIPHHMRDFLGAFPFHIPGFGYPFIFNNCNQIINSRNRNADKKDIEKQLNEYLNKITDTTTSMTKKDYDDYKITLHFSFPKECLPTTNQYISDLKEAVLSENGGKLKTDIKTAAHAKGFISSLTNKYYKNKNNNINMITVYFDNHYKEIPFKGKPSLKYIKKLFTNNFNMFEKKMI